MKVTRTDVAKLAGVSTATVSNVLSNNQKVKHETTEKVMEAVKQLDYRPDMIARSLSTRKTMQIGILLEDMRNPLYGEIVESFEAAAKGKGYFVNICTGTKDVDTYFDNFIDRGLDGAFVAALPYKFRIEKLYSLLEHDIKLIVSGNINADYRLVSSIENDYLLAMQQAIDYLLDLGHEDIAYLSGLGKELSYDERCSTYLKYMEKLNLQCASNLLVSGQFPYHTDTGTGYREAQRLLESGKKFTAVICGNDLMAVGAIRAFSERGLSVPRDISVMGFDGIDLGHYISPTLTTMAMNPKTFGQKAFELLHSNMANDTTGFFRNVLTFVEGESTAKRK